jgi:hypothetical protein
VWGACLGAIGPATEDCNGGDEDCDGMVDEGCDCRDGTTRPCGHAMVGLCRPGMETCVSGRWATCMGGINPATEICNSLDDDCDGVIDNGCDDDGDDYCDKGMTVVGTPATCTAGGEDCNDGSASSHPGATEICDNLDNDCDGVVDEGCDDDNDNYCDKAMTVIGKPATCMGGGGDCNDGSATIHPGVIESCDGVDEDCNSVMDDALWAFGGAAANTACYIRIPLPATLGAYHFPTKVGNGDENFNGHGPIVATRWSFELVSNRVEADVGLSARETVSDWTQFIVEHARTPVGSAFDGKIVEILGTERDGTWHGLDAKSKASCTGSYAVPNFPADSDWQVVYTDNGYEGTKSGGFQFAHGCNFHASYECVMNTPDSDWSDTWCRFWIAVRNYVWVRRLP